MAGLPGDLVFTATGPFRSVEDRVPMVVVRRNGSLVRFMAGIEPVSAGRLPTGCDTRSRHLHDFRGGFYPMVYKGGLE